MEAIRQLGGSVRYGSGHQDFVPDWLEDALGPDFFAPVVGVRFDTREVGDADLAVLKRLPRLREVHLECTSVRGPGLVHLKKQKKLESLRLEANYLTDECAPHLANLTTLTELSLCRYTNGGFADVSITDESLRVVDQFEKLEHLHLRGMRITDAGLAYLGDLENLRSLSLLDARITGTGLLHPNVAETSS